MAAEGASYEIKRPILGLADVTELILVGGFHGISSFCQMGKGDKDRGLIAYLRSVVFSATVALRQLDDNQYDALRSASLFDYGILS